MNKYLLIALFLSRYAIASEWNIFNSANSPTALFKTVVADKHNTIWALGDGDSLFRYRNGQWTSYSSFSIRNDSCIIRSAFTNAQGELCIIIDYMNSGYTIVKALDTSVVSSDTIKKCYFCHYANIVLPKADGSFLATIRGITGSTIVPEMECGLFQLSTNGCSEIIGPDDFDSLLNIQIPVMTQPNAHYSASAHSLAIDSNNAIWAGLIRFDDVQDDPNYGLFYYKGDSMALYSNNNSSLPNDHINCLFAEASNVVWIGTDNGLAKLHDGTWTVYRKSNTFQPNSQINCFFKDSKGGMWIGTEGGIARLVGQDWSTFNPDSAPVSVKKISSIAEDSSGNIWMAAGTSLAVYNPNGVNLAFSPLQSRSEHEFAAPISRLVFGFSSRVDQAMSAARYFDIRGRDMGRVGFSGQSKGVCIMRRNGAR